MPRATWPSSCDATRSEYAPWLSSRSNSSPPSASSITRCHSPSGPTSLAGTSYTASSCMMCGWPWQRTSDATSMFRNGSSSSRLSTTLMATRLPVARSVARHTVAEPPDAMILLKS